MKKIIIILSAGILCLIVIYFTRPTPEQKVITPPAGEITIEGETLCLPHENTNGPQTMECALGIKDSEGRYYGLGGMIGIPMGENVVITGTFTPRDGGNYQSIGVIQVQSIHE